MPSDVNAGAALTLVMPVITLIIVLAWAYWRHREWVR
jgi:cbb3-type cytochrome oxidase subunit 3